jgi:molybdopterin-guanine dinucleotide biosynthesis protein A
MLGDVRRGCGPMGGLHAALAQTEAEAVLLLACDMPNLPPDLLGALAAHAARTPDADICAPRIAGEPQPLCAVYRRRCLPQVVAALDTAEYALHHLLGRARTHWLSEADLAPFDPTGQAFVNLNTPDDLARWRQNPHTAGLES